MAQRFRTLADQTVYYDDNDAQPIGQREVSLIGADGSSPAVPFWTLVKILEFILLAVILVFAILAFIFAMKAYKNTTDVDELLKDKDYVRPCHVCCIKVLAVPLVVQSQQCYDIEDDFFVTNGSVAITIASVYDVIINFGVHHITYDGIVGGNAIRITNSSRITINDAHLFMTPQGTAAASRGVSIEPVTASSNSKSFDIWINRAWITGYRIGIFAQRCDVHVIDTSVKATMPGGGTVGADARGFSGQNAIAVDIRGGFYNLTYSSPSTDADGHTFGILFTSFNSLGQAADVGVNHAHVENVFVIAGYPIRINGGDAVVVRHNRIELDPIASESAAMHFGQTSSSRSVIVEGNTFNCSTSVQGSDCVLVWNARSLVFRKNTLYGIAPLIPGFYRPALLSIGLPFLSDFNFPVQQEAVLIEDNTISVYDNTSVAVQLQGSYSPDEKALTIRNLVIHRGLVGILLRNFTDGVVLENVKIMRSVYGIAAVNGTTGVEIKHSHVSRSCLCYFADDSTEAIGLYYNTAFHCVESYRDDGTGNEFSTGANTDGDNRMLGETGTCALPSLDDLFALTASVTSIPAFETALLM